MANTSNKQQLRQSRIEECRNSLMPAKQWCQENQAASPTYLYRAGKIRLEAAPEEKVRQEAPVFAQLPSEQDILSGPQKVGATASMFPGKARIEVSSSCPQNLLQPLAGILKRYA